MEGTIETAVVVSLLLIVLGGVWLILRTRFRRMSQDSDASASDFSILDNSSVMTPEERRKVRQALVKKLEKERLDREGKKAGNSGNDALDIESLLKDTRSRR
jgi:hypothetical protein